MKINHLIILALGLSTVLSCRQYIDNKRAEYQYFDKSLSDTISKGILTAITDEDYLQYGARVAFVNEKADTVIPFDKYAYLGTDTLEHYAKVIEYLIDSTYGRKVAIDRSQNILYDIVMFDNGPDHFKEGLVRVLRNGKMGFANEYGQVVIPCKYDFAWWFENGKAKVSFNAREYRDKYDDHKRVESDEWFYIDKKGMKIK